MKIPLTKKAAEKIASDYQWVKGQQFKTPHGWLTIDMVVAEPDEKQDGCFHVVVKHNAFAKHSIPEFFGFRNPSCDLLDYLEMKGIQFYPEK